MKPYKIIEGDAQALENFEQKVAAALEAGYTLAGELIVVSQPTTVRFYQPVLWSEGFDEEEWDEEDEEDME